MYNSQHKANEFDRIYMFYKDLERRERQPKLAWLIAVCTIPFVIMIAAYAVHHPITLEKLTTPHELVPSR